MSKICLSSNKIQFH